MKIGFIGLGKLGLPCALAIESRGHSVIGYDIDDKVNEIIKTKTIPYKEENAQQFLEKSNIQTKDLLTVLKESEIIFVAVQTPHEPKYEGITRVPNERVDFNYSYLKAAIKDISKNLDKLQEDKIIIVTSTVLPTTIEEQIKPLLSKHAKLCYNPFFIAMGTTINDYINPEFVLFGVDDKYAVSKAKEFYRTITSAPFYETSIVNAELIKVNYNTFITMKITWAQNLMEACHKIGGNADVDEVVNGISLATKRIISSAYMSGGMQDGGGCHPRDNIALSYFVQKYNLSTDLYDQIIKDREKQTEWMVELIHEHGKGLPKVILGKAYKPEINLIVGSPSILLKNLLDEKGIECEIYDPHVDMEEISDLYTKPHLYFIGTKHEVFEKIKFPRGSIVLDPFRYISKQDGVNVIGLGRGDKS